MRSNPIVDATYHTLNFTGSGSAAPIAPYDLVSSLLDPKHGVSNILITPYCPFLAPSCLSSSSLAYIWRKASPPPQPLSLPRNRSLAMETQPHHATMLDKSWNRPIQREGFSKRLATLLLEENHSGTVNLYKKATTNTIEVVQ